MAKKNKNYHIIGLVLKNRKENAIKLQEILSKHGNLIKTRLGIHETKEEKDHGLIILHVEGNEKEIKKLIEELNSLKEVNAKLLTLEIE